MKWTVIAKHFTAAGALLQIGDEIEASVQPPHTVPAHAYKPFEPRVEPVPINPGFVIRDMAGNEVPAGKPTRVVGINPHELRPFAKD